MKIIQLGFKGVVYIKQLLFVDKLSAYVIIFSSSKIGAD